MTLAPPEAQRRSVIRQASGQYHLSDAEGHQGRYVCPECPDKRHIPPFRPFALELHIREHEERTGHRVHVYCYVCCDFHTTEAMEAPLEITWLGAGPPERPLEGPESVLAAMEVLRRAGFLVRVSTGPPALPEPELVLLPYTEAETLKLVRERPGITTREIAKHFGLAPSTVKTTVRMLKLGGHITSDGFNDGWQRLYPTHDQPIGKVRPREQVIWRPWRNKVDYPDRKKWFTGGLQARLREH